MSLRGLIFYRMIKGLSSKRRLTQNQIMLILKEELIHQYAIEFFK